MRGSGFNKHQIKMQYARLKERGKYWLRETQDIGKQVFIPLAIFQLIRTILFPTALDVFLLILIFVIIAALLID